MGAKEERVGEEMLLVECWLMCWNNWALRLSVVARALAVARLAMVSKLLLVLLLVTVIPLLAAAL